MRAYWPKLAQNTCTSVRDSLPITIRDLRASELSKLACPPLSNPQVGITDVHQLLFRYGRLSSKVNQPHLVTGARTLLPFTWRRQPPAYECTGERCDDQGATYAHTRNGSLSNSGKLGAQSSSNMVLGRSFALLGYKHCGSLRLRGTQARVPHWDGTGDSSKPREGRM